MKPIRIVISILATLVVVVSGAYFGGFRLGDTAKMERLYDEPPEGAMRVLFVGNSHTFAYDVPGQLQHLGEAAQTPIFVDQITKGGATLEALWKQETARERITQDAWDFVVLQEQSTRPAFEPNKYFEYARKFADLAKRQGATPVVYATWERARWNKLYEDKKIKKKGITPTTLREALEESFRKAETEFDARLAPVSTAWLSFRRKNPSEPLHAEDGNHAHVTGAYLSACVFYRVLTGQKVSGNTFRPDDVDPEVARALQQEADRSPKNWVRQWRDQRRPPAPTRPPEPTRPQARPEAKAKPKSDKAAKRADDHPPRSALEALRREREAERRARAKSKSEFLVPLDSE